nr:hypothetical protein [Tanacetum cinerariifolium]
TDDSNILAGTQADDSDSKLQRQEYEAHSASAKHGFEFSIDTAALLPHATIEIHRNLVPAAGDPAGSIVPTGGVPARDDPAGGIVPTGEVLAGSTVPASDVPAGSIPASSLPAGGVLAGSLVSTDSAASSVPAASFFVLAVVPTDYAAISPLSPIYSLGSCAHTTRFPSPTDLGNHQHTAGIFSSSSYDDDFCADVTNLDSNVAVDPKSKFGESAFISYVQNQNRTNHADHLHCLLACFLSQLEPSSMANALADPDWVAAIEEEMQQFYHQQVWKLVPLPAGKIAISTKWILKNKRDAKGIVVCNKARLVAQGHRQEEGIDYDEDSRHIILVRVYVDDIIFGSTNKAWCDEFEVLMKASRPDIMFAMSVCSRHQLEAYSDSDYAGSHGDRKSTTGGCQFLGRRLISWQCKKQTVVATSSTEAEYVAAASCYGQVLLLVVQVRADDLVSAGGCPLPAGSYSFLLLDWFLLIVASLFNEKMASANNTSGPAPQREERWMSDQRRKELDATQLIYTKADWLDLLAKIATNFALSKHLLGDNVTKENMIERLGDDVTEENMNERLGMLLMRKRRELAEQSRVKPMSKTQQRDYMRTFVKNCSAAVYNS